MRTMKARQIERLRLVAPWHRLGAEGAIPVPPCLIPTELDEVRDAFALVTRRDFTEAATLPDPEGWSFSEVE